MNDRSLRYKLSGMRFSMLSIFPHEHAPWIPEHFGPIFALQQDRAYGAAHIKYPEP